MKKKVLITGAAGFIGSHTVDLFLKRGFEVKGLDNLSTGRMENLNHIKKNKNFIFKKIDLTNIKNNKFIEDNDYVIHFAGLGDIVPSINNPIKYVRNNFNGTLNLLKAIKINRIKKFVYAASSSCYGIAKTPTKETSNIDTKYPYAFSKYAGEQLCMHWMNVYNLQVNSIRIFNAYGPRSRTSGVYGAVFGVFMRQLLSKKPFTVVGDGNQKRDFLFVSDVANAFFKAATTGKTGKIWNIGSSKPQSINKLCYLLDKNNKIERIPKRPAEPEVTHADISKIKKDLNWKPKISFEDGVKIILNNKSYWKKSPLWTKKKIKNETRNWFKYLKKKNK